MRVSEMTDIDKIIKEVEEAENFLGIGDYINETTLREIVRLLKEYQKITIGRKDNA